MMEKKFKHPYEKFETTNLWKIVEQSVDDLIENQDIELTTRKEYVIGYICKQISLQLKKRFEKE